MAVRNTAVSGMKSMGIIFKQHGLAHKYLDGLTGVELGAAAHNPFGLQDSVNVAPEDDFEFYKGEQVKMCGAYAEVDIFAEAHALPLDDGSQDYVISSHVFEHLPDPIGTLKEWIRDKVVERASREPVR